MSENNELAVRREENFALGRLMPQNVRELAWFAGEAAKSGLFQTSAGGNQMRALSAAEAFMLMSTGIELGLTPLQGLRELSLIKGKVDVPPSVLAAKIASDPRVTMFDPEGDDKAFEIRAKRSDRDNGCTVRITWDDLPQADQGKHHDHAEDFLYARCVRRIVKRYFPDLKFGLASNVAEEPTRVIDIATVEKHVGPEKSGQPCEKCGDDMYLHPSRNGGVYSECVTCRHRTSPPQAVRDAIRGRSEDFVPEPDVEEEIAFQLGATPLPEPEEQTEARRDWTAQIITTLKVGGIGTTVENPEYVRILQNYGWPGKATLKWLEKLDFDVLESLRNDLLAIPVA